LFTLRVESHRRLRLATVIGLSRESTAARRCRSLAGVTGGARSLRPTG
jgi:hypothetical protein